MLCVHRRAVATTTLVVAFVSTAYAQTAPKAAIEPPAGPMVAVVALKDQTLVLYGPNGVIRSTGISSGLASNPTPFGIFSILEKRKEHWSNIYDAEMPHMQRLTWSGIALHEGRVTGRPASHGCIRLPAAFAEDLFAITRVGMRVIIGYHKTEPVEIIHDGLFSRRLPRIDALTGFVRVAAADRPASIPTDPASSPVLSGPSPLRAEALSLARKDARAQAKAAAKIDDDVKKLHASLLAEVARLTKARDTARRAAQSAERLEGIARKAFEAGAEDAKGRLETSLAAVTAKRAAAEALLQSADVALEAKRTANLPVLKDINDAETEAKSTWEAYRRLMRMGEPVSVLISGKTGTLYVRQAFDPIFEVPVSIAAGGGAPLGTHVFTIMERGSDASIEASDIEASDSRTDTGAMRWTVVSLPLMPAEPRLWHVADLPPTDAPEATASRALDRIALPADVRARIEAALVPGSSLIVTDEAPSSETGKGTDFIVELNLPQPVIDVARDARRVERLATAASARQLGTAKRQTPTGSFDTRKLFASDR